MASYNARTYTLSISVQILLNRDKKRKEIFVMYIFNVKYGLLLLVYSRESI